ncbi:hypothetical protein PT974_00757 [Cladobotryum mycophilum]|uniref:Uncharacterized protein n=1 Tax=Cladobotryum mycophilum TaxID=491253 RepID=A0ABR0T1S0_9HYPO
MSIARDKRNFETFKEAEKDSVDETREAEAKSEAKNRLIEFDDTDTYKARVKAALAFARAQRKMYGFGFTYGDIFTACDVPEEAGVRVLRRLGVPVRIEEEPKTLQDHLDELNAELGSEALKVQLDELDDFLWSHPEPEDRNAMLEPLLPVAGTTKSTDGLLIDGLSKRGWEWKPSLGIWCNQFEEGLQKIKPRPAQEVVDEAEKSEKEKEGSGKEKKGKKRKKEKKAKKEKKEKKERKKEEERKEEEESETEKEEE